MNTHLHDILGYSAFTAIGAVIGWYVYKRVLENGLAEIKRKLGRDI
jgi:hypothetical protein